MILTKGATAELRAPLAAFGLPVAVGAASASFVSELEVFGDGERRHRIASLGEPFRPDEVTGWMAPHLAAVGAVVCGAQWRDDFPGATLRALAARRSHRAARRAGPDAAGAARRGGRRGAARPGVGGRRDRPEVLGAGGRRRCSATAPPGASGIPVVVVTRGLAGAVVHLPDGVAEVAGEPVRGLADAIGAGDTFMTLMAVALLDGADPVAAATAACAGTSALLRRRLDPPA